MKEKTEEDYIREGKIEKPIIEVSKEEFDKLTDELQVAQLQLQEANDTLNGGITSRNMASFRNTYVINESDSLDSSYPMYVYFNVLEEVINIVSVKVSFWIHKYRAYSKAATSSESTPSGGGATSGGGSASSGGGSTSGLLGSITGHLASLDGDSFWKGTGTGYYVPTTASWGVLNNHSHTTPNHTHPSHTHSTPDHTHPAHTHDVEYGIYEEDNTPTIKFSVSQDGGIGYSKEYGRVPTNQLLLDVTDSITGSGSKVIKFESTVRARLTVQIEVKLDIKVR